jgi:ADP-heptose:LPS heptosyltransferase
MAEKSYKDGYVKCGECLNLESYWKNGAIAFFMCRVKPVSMKKLETRWRLCNCFTHTNQPPTERKNQIK